MKGRAIKYSEAEMAWLETNHKMMIGDYRRAFCKKFNREDVSEINLNSLRKRRGWSTGRTGQFNKGQTPHNKGKKMPFNQNSAQTQFKKGNLPHNAHYLGHERVSKDGYVEISVAQPNPHTGFERCYVLKHRHEWEKQNGPIPKGMALKCLDGDKTNTSPTNWQAIPRAMLPRLSGRYGRGFDHAPEELKPTIMAVTKLEHKARVAAQSATKGSPQ